MCTGILLTCVVAAVHVGKPVDSNLFLAVFSFEKKECCRFNRQSWKYGSSFISERDYKLRTVVRQTWSFSFHIYKLSVSHYMSLWAVERSTSFFPYRSPTLVDRGREWSRSCIALSSLFLFVHWHHLNNNKCMHVVCLSVCLLGRWITFFLLFIYFLFWPLYLSLSMTLLRLNRLLLTHLVATKPTRLAIPTCLSSVSIRHATEIRSRRPVQSNVNTKSRKNTVNPIAQVKKLGAKAG